MLENSVFSVPLWLISALSIREVILNTFLRPNHREPNALASGLGGKNRRNQGPQLAQSAHRNLNQVPFADRRRSRSFNDR